MFSAADMYITLNAFGTTVEEIAKTEVVTAKALLGARPVTVT